MVFPFFRQHDSMDCGPSCLRMIVEYYGRSVSLQELRNHCFITREGVTLLGISESAEHIGMRTLGVKISWQKLLNEAALPCIAHIHHNHFVVVYKITKSKAYIADPAYGLVVYTKKDFLRSWAFEPGETPDNPIGVALLLEPGPDFYKHKHTEDNRKRGFSYFFSYLFKYKRLLWQIFLGFIIGGLLQLLFPFLTQVIVDHGIGARSIPFIYVILAGQLMLFLTQTAVEMIRSWIFLHIGTRVSISIISDFLVKLMKLPLPFFDTKSTGDILQRIGDHSRIEQFLTSGSISIVFALFNLVILGVILYIYNSYILWLFLAFSIVSICWILFFMRERRELDHKTFQLHSDQQSNLVHLIQGIQEIKLNGIERQKRWEWERLQAKQFKLSLKGLTLSQYQQGGTAFLNQLRNILITFIAARAVINGEMTLGMMMAIMSFVGQLSSPIVQLIGFLQQTQNAKLSLERLQEVHHEKEESDYVEDKIHFFPQSRTLTIQDLTFQYGGPHSPKILKKLTLQIPGGKVTAIVGPSGSGKTTLLKLLLNFYSPTEGTILLGDTALSTFDSRLWRKRCGTVMQDGFIFSDTISRNIAFVEERVDRGRLVEAVKMANIKDFIEGLPLNYLTKIGQDGLELSIGQKQRILIARAIYKNPEYLFFDEATSALDSNNEHEIMNSLGFFFEGKTVVIIAHRLSTVKKADQIVVLDHGCIVEKGNHAELTQARGAYFNLVKDQLELGS